MSLWLFALLFTAPGDIYRCVAEDGSVHFQGQPCTGEQIGAIRSKSAGSARRLREWLSELPDPSPEELVTKPGSPSPVDSKRNPGMTLPPRPTGEHSLAQCSEQFLDCANSDDETMDRCVARIPRCQGNRSADCCAAGFIGRYQILRHNGYDRKTAARNALLGQD